MDGNEGRTYVDMDAAGKAPPVSAQDTGNYSQTVNNDMLDDFFNQEGFSYIGLLLGTMKKNEVNQISGDQGQTRKDTEDDKVDTSTSFLDEEIDDPWNLNMFDNMNLDQVTDNPSTEQNYGMKHPMSEDYHDQASTSTFTDNSPNQTEEQRKDITEEDIHIFLQNEELAAEGKEMEEDTPNESDSQLKPEKGMQFQTREEARKFFNLYAYTAGFSVSIVSSYRTTSKKRNNEVIRFTMKCNKYGKINEQETEQVVAQRQSTVIAKSDCKVEMVVSEKKGFWKITGLNLLHNHQLSPQSRFFRSHIYMSNGEKEMIRTMKYCNMPTRDMVAVLAFIRGGMEQLPYNKRKVSNYSNSINRELTNNDMLEVLDWFKKKRTENPGFYHSLDLDKENKVRSVFWADARAIQYYDICGDCVSFDTTFLTNKYNLPFAPFVGVLPHGKTYLFACAFIVNETSESFQRCFREFKAAMGGKPPKTIITDQDKGMASAIPSIFPNAIHKCCLFHIKKKIDDKGGTVFQANEGLYEELQDIIDKSLTVHEFETLWQQMINEYNVGHIKIFQDLWKSREKWVPVYFKNHFFPFIQTTARSEGTNALFKKGVGPQFSMTSFLREYQRIMDNMHANENELDHNATNKKVREKKFITQYYIERQAHELYNLAIFRKFQLVLNDVTRLQIREDVKGKMYWVFHEANYPVREHRHREYLVQVNEETEDYSCICCKFDKDGLLCSHILKVMLQLQVHKKKDKKLKQSSPGTKLKTEKRQSRQPLQKEIEPDCVE
ncbi:protein FAR1-RELATED SEQUENCE 5-like [Lolium perenne]|uniref:protein FAR1-RELATED SEQUENCE 5-like n=1 Tax=Lolium perenne TaxID=4522 RepID=UPI0021F6948E|nr:protein FAR1-RELATED SEQUENCE 5-like [Lolium perenne]